MKPAIPPNGSPDDDGAERQRLSRVYEAYAADPYYRKIWSSTSASRFMIQMKWTAIAGVLRGSSIDLARARVLDLGAGDGGDCAQFESLGVGRGHLVALDILEARARRASRTHAGITSIVGNASRLPFRNDAFDVVYQSTMLSSVLDEDRRARILEEGRRVLKSGGVFLSYDVRYPNPWNRNTRPVGASELRRAFRGWPLRLQTLTALPPLVRLAAHLSVAACRVLESIAPLRSHLLVLARKP